MRLPNSQYTNLQSSVYARNLAALEAVIATARSDYDIASYKLSCVRLDLVAFGYDHNLLKIKPGASWTPEIDELVAKMKEYESQQKDALQTMALSDDIRKGLIFEKEEEREKEVKECQDKLVSLGLGN